MSKNATLITYGVAMVVVIAAVDILFFRNHFKARLLANVGIVLVFAAVYLVFLRQRR